MDKQWYVVNTYSGHENKVKEKLEMRAESMGMQDYIYRVVVPMEKVKETKNGVEKEHEKKMFPGSSGKGAKPTPLQPYEVDKILNSMGISRMDVDKDLAPGTKVNITDGPFKGMLGKIDSIDLENNKVNLIVDLFGQETSVEVEMSQIQKI